MTNHIRDFQILYDNCIGSLHEPSRFRMKPTFAGIGDLTVHSGHLRTYFMAAMTTSLAAAERALPAPQFFLCSPCNAWVRNFPLVTAIGEYR